MRRLLAAAVLALIGLIAPWQPDYEPATLAASPSFRLGDTTVAPNPIATGQVVTFATSVQARSSTTVAVQYRVQDAQGSPVFETTWPDQPFRRSERRTYAAEWTATAPAGAYVVLLRVLDGDAEVKSSATPFGIAGSEPAPAPAPGGLDAEEAAFLDLVNQYRQANGLAPLALHPALTAAAEWMSQDMADKNYFSHTDSLGRDPFTRMADFGYADNTWKGENIAAGYTTAAAVFSGWKSSAGHNANLLNPNYRSIGIGRAYRSGSTYGWYWTTDFGGA